MSVHDNEYSTLRPVDLGNGESSRAASCVAFLESMRSKYYEMMGAVIAPTAMPREHMIGRAEAEAIVSAARRGHTLEEITRQFQRSDAAVRKVLRKSRVRAKGMRDYVFNKGTRARREEGMALLRSGKTVPEVARELGISRPTVRTWRLRIEAERGAA